MLRAQTSKPPNYEILFKILPVALLMSFFVRNVFFQIECLRQKIGSYFLSNFLFIFYLYIVVKCHSEQLFQITFFDIFSNKCILRHNFENFQISHHTQKQMTLQRLFWFLLIQKRLYVSIFVKI